MGTKKRPEIKALGKATALDHEEARAELAEELRIARITAEIESRADELALRFDEFDPKTGSEILIDESLARRDSRSRGA